MSSVRNLLVIYVGGTIGMQKNEDGVYIPIPNTFFKKIKYSEMHDEDLAAKFHIEDSKSELIVRGVHDNIIIYKIEEYHPLLDSSNMSVSDWKRIVDDIEENYDKYDGFIVLHGTDTLAYTASALSFMLEGLQKPVILTGSQIPIFETRSDAKNNFLSSLMLAGSYDIPEVCVCFGNKLIRGNRTAKISSNLLNAFDSPNYHPLAEVGIDVTIYNDYIDRPEKIKPVQFHKTLNTNVGVVTLFPTITSTMLENFLNPPIEGIVLLTYGVGNVPSERQDLLKLFRKAVDRGVLIVNVTQCLQGTVNITYETGKALEAIGIVPGNDMTTEAALTKLMYVVGIPDLSYEQKVKLMQTNIRGELTDSSFNENNNYSVRAR